MHSINPNLKQIHDCIACLSRPLLRLGAVCGISTLSIKCPHTKKNPNPIAKFEISSALTILSAILYIFPLIGIIKSLVQVFSMKDEKMKSLRLTVEALFSIGAAATWILSLIQRKKRMLELNGLSVIIENRQYYGISTFLSTKATKIFLRRIYLMIAFIIVIDLNFLLYSVYENTESEMYLNILRVIVIVLCSYVQSTAIFHCILETVLYLTLYKKCFYQLKRALKERIIFCNQEEGNDPKRKVVSVSPVELPLEITLRRLSRLYLGLTYNYKQFVAYLNPAFTVWWLIVVSILILSFYFLVIVYINSEHDDILLTVRSYGSVFGIIVYLTNVERLNVMVRLITFLYVGMCMVNTLDY